MMVSESPVKPELCLVRPAAETSTQVLTALAQAAIRGGYAAPTFTQALIDREAAFPTGLPTPVPIAIPHTDVRHVLRPGLAAALLDPAVRFGEMGAGTDKQVDVRLAIALLVTDPTSQVGLLVHILNVAQRPDWADGLDQVDTPDQLADTLNRALGRTAVDQ